MPKEILLYELRTIALEIKYKKTNEWFKKKPYNEKIF